VGDEVKMKTPKRVVKDMISNNMRCPECGKHLTNEEDAYGHDCEVVLKKWSPRGREFIGKKEITH